MRCALWAGAPILNRFGVSLSALSIAGMVRRACGSADRVATLTGPVRARVPGRLSAFLLLCVGTSITLNSVIDVLGSRLRCA